MVEITALASSSKGNCYRVTDGSAPLLIECGIRFKDIQRGLNFRLAEIAGCLISHEHGDHAKSVNDMIRSGIDCYMSAGTAEALGVSGHRVKIVKAKEALNIGSWTILPFDVQHDAAEPLGFLLADRNGDKVLFATDTYYIRYKFRGLTHIMIECNYSIDILNQNIAEGRIPVAMKKRLLKSHFSLEHVKEFLRANDLSNVQEIWLLHLSDNNADATQFKREIMELTGKMVIVP